ncbi:MAG: PEP-CTERM sorting domain-containing protein [Planctomycetota bacterium]|nr:PEP-CTERM sorting domain-containing protein [Planctomycetota bacterium]
MKAHTIGIVVAAAIALLGAQAAVAATIITSPYSGADLLHMTTANNGSPGGISTPGDGSVGSPAGMTYLIQDGDGGPATMVDGVFNGDKFFSGGLGTTTAANMDSNTPAGTWKWFDAHFTNAVVLSHFVYRNADHAFDRTPDQFQIRGSNDGGATWDVIFRLDANGDGTGTPWGASPENFTAVQFDGSGADFATPAAYKDIRLEVFSVTNGDGAGITEWQLAGAVPEPATMSVLLVGGLAALLRRKR